MTRNVYRQLLVEVEEAKSAAKKTQVQYRRLKRFDIVDHGGTKKLISKDKPGRYFLPVEDIFDVIEEAHVAANHGRRDKMRMKTKKYANITYEMINTFLSICEVCEKRTGNSMLLQPIMQNEEEAGPFYWKICVRVTLCNKYIFGTYNLWKIRLFFVQNQLTDCTYWISDVIYVGKGHKHSKIIVDAYGYYEYTKHMKKQEKILSCIPMEMLLMYCIKHNHGSKLKKLDYQKLIPQTVNILRQEEGKKINSR